VVLAFTTLAPVKKGISLEGYLMIFAFITMCGILIYLIRRVKHNIRDIGRVFLWSLLLTIVFNMIFCFLSSAFLQTKIMCEVGSKCPSSFELCLKSSPEIAPFAFVAFAGIYYLFILVKTEKNKTTE